MKYYIPVQIKMLDGIQRYYYVQHAHSELAALILLKRKLKGVEHVILPDHIVGY